MVNLADRATRICPAIVVALLTLMMVPAWAGADVRTVYSSLPLAGELSDIGEDMQRGEQLALEQAGSRVGDTEVRYVPLNHGSDSRDGWKPDLVVSNARQAASDPSTIGYLGELSSAASEISMPLLNRAGILQISSSNRFASLTRQLPGCCKDEPAKHSPTGTLTYGRVIPADHMQAAAIARYAELLGARRVFLVDSGGLYGQGLTDMVRPHLLSRGISVVGRTRLRRPSRDARPIAGRIRRARADTMIYGGAAESGAPRLWREVHRRNPAIELLGGDRTAHADFASSIPRAARRRTHITYPWLDPGAYPSAGQAFLADFRARYGRDPGREAIYAYEAMSLLVDSMRRAGPGADRSAVVRAFFATRDRDSVLGRYSIDPRGDTTLPTYAGVRISPQGELVHHRTLDSGE